MKKLCFISCSALCHAVCTGKDYADYVSPLVGTRSSFELSTEILILPYPAVDVISELPRQEKWGTDVQLYVYTANKNPWFQTNHQPVRGLMTMVNFPSCP